MGALRQAILNKFQIVQAKNNSFSELVKLPADDFPVYMIEDPVTVSDLLRWICEMNGCFMALNGNGNAEYIFVGDDKFADGKDTEIYDFYMNVETEDYTKSGFDSMYISGFESGCGCFSLNVGSTHENMYFMDGNSLLTTGYEPKTFSPYLAELQKTDIPKNFTISYTPLTLTSQARLWVQLGDRIVVNIKWYDLDGKPQQTAITSLVLSRNLTGIQALKDEITANGENMRYTEEYFDEEEST